MIAVAALNTRPVLGLGAILGDVLGVVAVSASTDTRFGVGAVASEVTHLIALLAFDAGGRARLGTVAGLVAGLLTVAA